MTPMSPSRTSILGFITVLLVTLQGAFLQPYIVLLHGERANLFTTLLTGLALLVITITFAMKRKSPPLFAARWEPWVWGGLGFALAISACLSLDRLPSIFRAASFYLPALAGYLCGRAMAGNELWDRWATPLFTTLFGIMSAGQIAYGFGAPFFHVHHHAMANILLLFAAGPFTLFNRAASWKGKTLATGILALGFGAAYLIGSRFVILLPFVLLPLLGGFRRIKPLHLLGGMLLFLTIAAAFFHQLPDKVLRLHDYESVFYRVETIPTAMHIVPQRPFFGIGLRASREPYLKDYELQTGLTSTKGFMDVIRKNVTFDNMLTTMLVGTGLIPTLLYLVLLATYCRRLLLSQKNIPKSGLTYRAIGLAVTCCLIHFLVHDGLLYPQINWNFHLLLGLVAQDEKQHGARF